MAGELTDKTGKDLQKAIENLTKVISSDRQRVTSNFKDNVKSKQAGGGGEHTRQMTEREYSLHIKPLADEVDKEKKKLQQYVTKMEKARKENNQKVYSEMAMLAKDQLEYVTSLETSFRQMSSGIEVITKAQKDHLEAIKKINKDADDQIKQIKENTQLSEKERQKQIKDIESNRKQALYKQEHGASPDIAKSIKDAFSGSFSWGNNLSETLLSGFKGISDGLVDGGISEAIEVAIPGVGTAITVIKSILAVVHAISGTLDKGVQASANLATNYLGKINARLKGTDITYETIQDFTG